MPINLPPGMGIEDMRSVPANEMPMPTAPPSIEELFRQGNVRVTPGATGAEAMRQSSGGYPVASGQLGDLEMLARVGQMGAQASPDTNLAQYGMLEQLMAPAQARVQARDVEAEKARVESEKQKTQITAAKEMATMEQRAAMERVQEEARLRQAGDIARIQAEAKAKEQLMDQTMISSGPLAGYFPPQLRSMRPDQISALLGAYVGSQHMKDFATLVQAVMMSGKPPDEQAQYIAMALKVFGPPGTDIKKYMKVVTDPKTGRPTITFAGILEELGLAPGGTAGPRVQPGETQLTPSISAKEPESLTPSIMATPGVLEQGNVFDLSQIGLAP